VGVLGRLEQQLSSQGLADQEHAGQRGQGGKAQQGGRLQGDGPLGAKNVGVLGLVEGVVDEGSVPEAALQRLGECCQPVRAALQIDRDEDAVLGRSGP
jgi:hypothetical protein